MNPERNEMAIDFHKELGALKDMQSKLTITIIHHGSNREQIIIIVVSITNDLIAVHLFEQFDH